MKRLLLGAGKLGTAAVVGWTVSSAVAGTINSPAPGKNSDSISRADATDCGAWGAVFAVMAVGVLNRIGRRLSRSS